jgi:hypothetical protein
MYIYDIIYAMIYSEWKFAIHEISINFLHFWYKYSIQIYIYSLYIQI